MKSDRITQMAGDVAKGYAAVVANDRFAMMLLAGLALVGPDIKADYGMTGLFAGWCGILALWFFSNAPKSKRLDQTFHRFADETGYRLLLD